MKMILALILIWPMHGFAISLEDFLKEVQIKNKIFKNFEQLEAAAQAKKSAGDSGLMPVLTMKASQISDKNPKVYAPTYVQTDLDGIEYSLGVAKRFSTGTALSSTVSLGEGEAEINGVSRTKQGTGSLSFAVSQSLWRDSFGKSTRLRWAREGFVEDLEVAAVRAQQSAALVDAEAAFWDYLYISQEVVVRKGNLIRAKKLNDWMQKRVANGIADRSDLVQIQALVASRELQLSMADDEYVAATAKIKDLLEMTSDQEVPRFEGKLEVARKLEPTFVAEGPAEALPWDAYISTKEAGLKKTISAETQEGLAADLQLKASYATHSSGSGLSEAQSEITKTDKSTQAIAIEWTYLFDGSTKSSIEDAANRESAASQLKSERKLLEGKTQWAELQRRWAELSKKIKSAETIARLQSERVKLEQDRLAKGRTVTSAVITAEQEAEEAELNLSKLKSEQRKLEARSRMFVAAGRAQ
jgi:outer membrane protein TolC